ncbi:hypothetical protein LUZ63_011230 [Rhynchospora breviuscula]|uniref:Dolichyl-diphosphooligosaccharide-protein glycosyltransferase subunit OST5 n=1 Tax=Rhynchospora breviuscula TaxID=2022672 RepID=A0A9Q0CIC1_9POAL|nr:hypothetical protein LUZ63_011230 [Rhynchospora breviuscula]
MEWNGRERENQILTSKFGVNSLGNGMGSATPFHYPLSPPSGAHPKTTVRTSEIRRASLDQILMALKSVSSPVPVALYPSLAVVMLSVGFMITAFFFIYEATSTRKSRSLTKELVISLFASVFLGFGSLFLLLASGVYV